MHLPAAEVDVELDDALLEAFDHVGRAIHRRALTAQGGLAKADYGVLALLGTCPAGAMRLVEVADAAGHDASTMSRRLAALEARGLVERHPDPDDGRARRLALSEHGRAVLDAERGERARRVADAVRGWPEADRRTLADLLARLVFSLGHPATTDRTTHP